MTEPAAGPLVEVMRNGMLRTRHVGPIKTTADPDELEAIAAEYSALAAHIRAMEVDAAQVDAIAEVLVGAVEQVDSDPPKAAARMYRGGLRATGGA